MKPLFDISIINEYKSKDLVSFECYQCSKLFWIEVKWIKYHFKHPLKSKKKYKFCSKECSNASVRFITTVKCGTCSKNVEVQPKKIKNSKSGKNFCSSSCAATYNNTHKTYGTRVSKLELYLQKELTSIYSNLEFHFNRKDTINSELDIYIPSLNLAFELNGIFHYEPIYGKNKLDQIQNNDSRKFQACLEKNIELCIIDASSLSYFKPANAKKYLDIVNNVISMKLKNQ